VWDFTNVSTEDLSIDDWLPLVRDTCSCVALLSTNSITKMFFQDVE
jgi:hypothetical protein